MSDVLYTVFVLGLVIQAASNSPKFSKMIGRIAHYAVDAVLLSTALAGVRRSTGLQFNTEKIQSEDVRSIVNKYLAVGESGFDIAVGFLNSSSYFERKHQ